MELNIFVYLSVAFLLALISSKLVKKVHMPNVTGYLLIGLLAGPYCLNLLPVETIETLSFIPSIALGFIALSIGAEFKISYLKRVGKAPFIIALLEGLFAVIAVDVALVLTGHDLAFSLVLGAIAAATAPAATLMIVKQYRAKGPVTSTLLPVVAIDDAVALIAFGISVAIAKSIQNPSSQSLLSSLVHPIIELGGSLVFGAILGLIFTLLVHWFKGRGNRMSIAFMMVLFCVGICKVYALSELLACMMMSAVFVNTSRSYESVFSLIDRVTPPLFMLFFFVSGAELDISVITSIGLVGAIYVAFRVFGKVSGAYLGARIANCTPTVQKYLGLTLVPQAGVAIGLAATSVAVVPEFGATIKTIVLCATVIYEITGPLITKLALTKAGEIQ